MTGTVKWWCPARDLHSGRLSRCVMAMLSLRAIAGVGVLESVKTNVVRTQV
jgi:hypothetical protein